MTCSCGTKIVDGECRDEPLGSHCHNGASPHGPDCTIVEPPTCTCGNWSTSTSNSCSGSTLATTTTRTRTCNGTSSSCRNQTETSTSNTSCPYGCSGSSCNSPPPTCTCGNWSAGTSSKSCSGSTLVTTTTRTKTCTGTNPSCRNQTETSTSNTSCPHGCSGSSCNSPPGDIIPSCSYNSWQDTSPIVNQYICEGTTSIQQQKKQTRTHNGSCSGTTTRWVDVGNATSCGTGSSCSSNQCSLPSVTPLLTSTTTSVIVSWLASSNTNVGGYEIRHCKSNTTCQTTTGINISSRTTTIKTITNLDPSSTYRVKMRTKPVNSNTHTNGSYSSEISINTKSSILPSLPIPTGLSLTGVTTNSMIVTWTPSTNTNTSGYQLIYCRGDNCIPSTTVDVSGRTNSQQVLRGLYPVSKYRVQIRAISGSPTSHISSSFSSVVEGNTLIVTEIVVNNIIEASLDSEYSEIQTTTTQSLNTLQCVADQGSI